MASPAAHSIFSERILRRDLLRIGSLGAVGLALPDLLRAEPHPTDPSPSPWGSPRKP